jgi:hypothetical protein
MLTANFPRDTQAVRRAVGRPASAWPRALSDQAFHGVAGQIVRAIEPHTESDPVALLVQTLVAFGNVIGRSACFRVEADVHFGNLFAALVGVTSKARKGTSWGHVRCLFGQVDSDWADERIVGGLSSGEGLIWAVRDPVERREPITRIEGREDGQPGVGDEGIGDKRTLVLEAEFASPLRVMARDGNTLSGVLRVAWDTGALGTLTKNSPARATGAHISLLSHSTKDELLRYLSSTETGNGFANRFLWVCVRRSKMLPEGGRIDEVNLAPIISRLNDAITFARRTGEVRRNNEARDMWCSIYPMLSEGKAGLLGSVTSRAEAQVVRLSLLYAVLDCSQEIRLEHLQAALAVWQYCESSAKYIFGDAIGNPEADALLSALRTSVQGLTRTQIRDQFGRHRTAQQIDSALGILSEQSLARSEVQDTEGRSIERWYAIDSATEATEAT